MRNTRPKASLEDHRSIGAVNATRPAWQHDGAGANERSLRLSPSVVRVWIREGVGDALPTEPPAAFGGEDDPYIFLSSEVKESSVQRRSDAYDPEATVLCDFKARAPSPAPQEKTPSEPPLEETKLLEAPAEKTQLMRWMPAPIAAPPQTALRPVRLDPRPAPAPVNIIRRQGEPTARTARRRVRVPLPLWVHIALASAWLCCVVLTALFLVAR